MSEPELTGPNILPGRYRQVAVASDVPGLDLDSLTDHLLGREVYFRTRYLVAHHGGETALVEVLAPETTQLFTRVEAVRLLAGADRCAHVVDPAVDVGIPSALGRVASQHPGADAVVVEGRYGHVSFLLHPQPLHLVVHDVVDPQPAKLVDQVTRVLDVAEDLPPIWVEPRLIDVRRVLAASSAAGAEHVLVPCRGSGLELGGAEVHFLDERPARAPWTLLGCERSQQIHRWFYGERAELVDTCPRRFIDGAPEEAMALSRCCLLQEGVDVRRHHTEVPWGASLGEVRAALEQVVLQATEQEGFSWHRT